MGKVIDKIIEKAKQDIKRIVLPESEDIRVLKAAEIASKNKTAKIILIGVEEEIDVKCRENNIDISEVQVINPNNYENREIYTNMLYNLRKEKGMTQDKANELTLDNIYFGTMMVKAGDADGLVCGACHSSADTLRPALQIIKTKKDAKCVSAFFIMELLESNYKDAYIFSDSGLVEFPTDEQRAEIAIQANDSFKILIGETPKVAMLSYSTMGSAASDSIESVKNSLRIVKEKRPDILIDGELQVDAAVDKTVAKLKAPESEIAGDANIFIFPDLNAGNIGYKLVQRFGRANAYGPITQGLDRPINDLSRGCNAEDIVGAIAITAVQALTN